MRDLPALILLLLMLALPVGQAEAESLAEHFQEMSGCIVILDGETGEYFRYNPERCREHFTPCSSFKIAHALIALDCGVISPEELGCLNDSGQ